MNTLQLKSTQRARLVLLASVVLTVLLYVVPYGRYVAYPLMLLSTLVHEMGHGVANLVVGLGEPLGRRRAHSLGWPVAAGGGQDQGQGHKPSSSHRLTYPPTTIRAEWTSAIATRPISTRSHLRLTTKSVPCFR